jgi:hypothetical protein
MRAISVVLLLLVAFVLGCREPSAPSLSGRRGTPTAATAKPRPFLSARTLRAAALHKDPEVVILAFTNKQKGIVWMLQDESGDLSLLESAPRVHMLEVKELSVSPDDYYLAVISRGEGHPVLEAFRLSGILAPPGSSARDGIKSIAWIDPFPGDISISGWQGRKLGVQCDMPLDRLDHKTRRAAASDSYPSDEDMRFQWDIETDTIVRR